MKKQLLTADITNELNGASVFFQSKHTPTLPTAVADEKRATVAEGISEQAGEQPVENVSISLQESSAAASKQPSAHEPVIPRHHATTPPSNQAMQMPTMPATIDATTVERIRKTVKQLGKEAATHRFTPEEKRQLADIVYTYERRGCRTSENEITRIAINWMLGDYQEFGEQSMLARLLEALHR